MTNVSKNIPENGERGWWGKSYFDHSDEGMCLIRMIFDEADKPIDYLFLEINPAFEKQTGLKNAEGKTMRELAPNHEEHWFKIYGDIAKTGKPKKFEQKAKNLGQRWYQVQAFPAGQRNSNLVGIIFKDITSQKQAEKALMDSEKRFRNFADTAPAVLWVTNAEGKCTFISKGWSEVTGIPQSEAHERGWHGAIHPDDIKGIKAAFKEHNRQEKPFRLEYRLRLKDNTYHWVLDVGKPHWDDEGEFLGYVGSIIDINDRIKVEEALRESENLLKITMDQLPVGVNISDAPEGKLLFQNRAAKEIIGHDQIETNNITGYSKYRAMHSDGTPFQAHEYPLVRAIQGNIIRQEEMLYRKGDGSIITLNVNSAPVRDEHNNIVRAVSAFQDITELRRAQEAVMLSEAHLKLILESATDYAIFTMNLNLEITDWNTGAEEILGFTKEEVLGKKGNIIHLPEEKEDELGRKVKTAREQGKVESEGWYIKKDGTRFYGQGTIMPLRDRNEGLLGYLKIMRDYSDKRKVEEALKRAKDEAEKASQAKDEFLAHMSHEIRTPLNAIIGLSNLLVRRNEESNLIDDLQTVKFSADNLRMLVDDILDFSKIQAGKVDIENTSVNIRHLLQNLEKAHLPQARERNNSLEVVIGEDIPTNLCTDSLRLSQILNNLLSNAIKFTQNGVVQLHLKLHKREGKKAWLDFAVKDTGCGIPEEKQHQIFEKFMQADTSTVRKYGGTGLGLSITKLLLELMGSHIRLDSKEGEGSTFYFTLPVEIATEKKTNTKGDEVDEIEFIPRKLRLLIVEDSEINRLVLMQFLQLWGDFDTDQAENGEEALARCKEKAYDVILMDLRMPVMDGYQATEAIREDPNNPNSETPIIALTADTPGELKKKPQFHYFTDVLTKPFEPEVLRTKMLKASARYNKEVEQSLEKHQQENVAKKPEQLPKVDLSKVIEVFQGNAEGISKLLRTALPDFEAFYHEYPEALLQRDHSAMDDYVHKRKPMFNMLMLQEVDNRLEAICEEVKEEVSEGKLQELHTEAKQLLGHVVTSMEQHLEEYSQQSEGSR